MKFLKAIGSFLQGDFVGNAMKFVNERWPPDMSEAQRKQMQMVLEDMLHRQKMELAEAARQDEGAFNERTIAMEGTAKDLAAIPYVGALIIFMRGAFRPLFSYATMYFDWLYFSGGFTFTERQETLLLSINLLVLVFFFGERAMKNVMPLITNAFIAKANGGKHTTT
jgi:hypothetical protein